MRPQPAAFILASMILISLGPFSALGEAYASGRSPRGYRIWSSTLSGDLVVALQTVNDVDGDGFPDAFTASKVAGNGYLVLINGRTGGLIERSGPLGYEPREALYVGRSIAVARRGGVDVYTRWLVPQYTLATGAAETVPRRLQTFDGTSLLCLEEKTLTSYDVATGAKRWSVGKPVVADYGVLSPRQAVYVYPEWNQWTQVVIDASGNELATGTIPGSAFTDQVAISEYNEEGFLYVKTNISGAVLGLSLKQGSGFTGPWQAQVDASPGNVGFAITDVNRDGWRDILAAWGGFLTVFSGLDGSMLYQTRIPASSVARAEVVSDIDGDGIGEIFLHAGGYYLASFRANGYVTYLTGPEGSQGMAAITDLDGDGKTDLVAATLNILDCLWGSYDDTDPSLDAVAPGNATYHTSNTVTVKARASDAQSGIREVRVYIDGDGYSASYNPATGLYESSAKLGEGPHRWSASVYDKVGYSAHSQAVTFYVDLSPPVIADVDPANGSFAGASLINATWTASDAGSAIGHYDVKVDSAAWTTIGAEASYALPFLDDGPHTFTVRAYDMAGFMAESSTTFTVDTIKPTVSITAPPDAAYVNRTSLAVTWTGFDANLDYYMLSVELEGVTSPWAYPIRETSYALSGLKEGAYHVYVRAQDKARNTETASILVTVDVTPPTLVVTAPKDGSYTVARGVLVQWNSSDRNPDHFEVSIDAGPWMNVGSGSGYLIESLTDGSHALSVKAIDKAGNAKEATVMFTVDGKPPKLTVTSPENGEDLETPQVNVTWTGQDEESGIGVYRVKLDEGEWRETPESGLGLTGVSERPHTIVVEAVDKAGNTVQVSVAITVGKTRATQAVADVKARMDALQGVGVWSDEARRILSDAKAMYDSAAEALRTGDYATARSQAEESQGLMAQAENVENTLRIAVIGAVVVAAAIVIVAVIALRRRRRTV